MEIVNGFNDSAIERAVQLLKAGDVVAFPTETVYGLGADGFDPYGVARIFEMKKRPRFDPLILHLGEKGWVERVAEELPDEAMNLIEHFWPGPLTIILKKRNAVPPIVTAGLATVAVRMPSHPVALRLINAFGNPIAAPSANPFGYVSPTRALHVGKMFRDKPILVLDGGNSIFGIESTILSFREGKTYIHRHGAISVEEIAEVAGEVLEKTTGAVVEAPGELPYHYAPHRPLRIVDSPEAIVKADSSFLAFTPPAERPVSKYMKILSAEGDLREAAANFFSHLIELDRDDVSVIYAERLPSKGIGRAMMERLEKAARKSSGITP